MKEIARGANAQMLQAKLTEAAEKAAGSVNSILSGANRTTGPIPAGFMAQAHSEEAEHLRIHIAPVLENQVIGVLNHFADSCVQAALERIPYQPVRFSRTSTMLLPLIPADVVGDIWSTIDTVGRRIYGSHF